MAWWNNAYLALEYLAYATVIAVSFFHLPSKVIFESAGKQESYALSLTDTGGYWKEEMLQYRFHYKCFP